MSIARRLAHDLGVYYKMDADIVLEMEMALPLSPGTLTDSESGNIIVIGSPNGRYIRQCLEKGKTAFSIADRQDHPPVLQLRGEPLNDSSQGIHIFLSRCCTRIQYREHRSQVSCSPILTKALHHPQCCSLLHMTDQV